MSLTGLLNLGERNHHVAVVTDFELPASALSAIREAIGGAPTHLHFVSVAESADELIGRLVADGIVPERDYVSLLAVISRHQSFDVLRNAQVGLPRGDLARLELPSLEMGFSPGHAVAMLNVVLASDFRQQERASAFFYELLGLCQPYSVVVETRNGVMNISGRRPWFQLAGRLAQGESRILPGGEVAYTGSDVSGTFTVDGGLLATPERPSVAPLAVALTALSRRFADDPVDFYVENGQVLDLRSRGALAGDLSSLLNAPAYRRLTEVGVSFNSACTALIHDWPASANEGFPGVHIAVGGDPDPDEDDALQPAVHLDLIAATAAVHVNSRAFLRRDGFFRI